MFVKVLRVLIFILGAFTALATARGAFGSGIFNNTTILLACITIAILFYGYFFPKLIKQKWLTASIFTGAVAVLGFCLFLGIYGSRVTTTFTEDAVIVLGAGTHGGEPLPSLARRLDAAVSYHRQNPGAIIVVSGGVGHRQDFSEAYIMAQYLIRHGVNPDIILLEEAAYSTYSNMRYSNAILQAHFGDIYEVVIITNEFHMYRSVRFAQQVGLNATIYPAPTPLRAIPLAYVREVASVVKLWVLGR